MISKSFFESAEFVAETRGIAIEDVYETMRKGITAAYKKKYKNDSCRVDIKPEKASINLVSIRKVVETLTVETEIDKVEELLNEIEKPEVEEKKIAEISLQDALLIKKNAKVGDIIEFEENIKEFSRAMISAIKQTLNQDVKVVQRKKTYEFFKPLEGEMVNGTITYINDRHIVVFDLGNGGVATLPQNEVGANAQVGQTMKLFVKSVEETTKDPKITVSRNDRSLVTRLMEQYIPEIKEGIIEIKGIARDAGDRSKIALYSNDPKVDAIGSCVGEGGTRIQEIVRALGGEKVDLYKWSEDPEELIINSLQPASVTKVLELDEKNKTSLVAVPDDHLSLAIGKAGQNVRLAVQSCGWKIDIMPVSKAFEQNYLINDKK